jgi:aromatic ring hydroxylase
MPNELYVLWWVGLIVTLAVFVPWAVYLLHRTWSAARSIERYAAEALTAAAGIVGNTRNIVALDATIGVAGDMLQAAGSVVTKLDAAATALAERAGDTA